jgi:hypothetical protein
MANPSEKQTPKTAEDIYREALKLSVDEQEKLSCMLTQGLQDPDSWYAAPEIAQAWNQEIRRRLKLRAEGKSKDVPGDEFLAQLREKYSL